MTIVLCPWFGWFRQVTSVFVRRSLRRVSVDSGPCDRPGTELFKIRGDSTGRKSWQTRDFRQFGIVGCLHLAVIFWLDEDYWKLDTTIFFIHTVVMERDLHAASMEICLF